MQIYIESLEVRVAAAVKRRVAVRFLDEGSWLIKQERRTTTTMSSALAGTTAQLEAVRAASISLLAFLTQL